MWLFTGTVSEIIDQQTQTGLHRRIHSINIHLYIAVKTDPPRISGIFDKANDDVQE